MQDFVELAGYFAITASISIGLAYAVTSMRVKKGSPAAFEPESKAVFRIRCSTGVVRSSFLGEEEGAWAISAPLQRDSLVPLRFGEYVTVEAPHSGGARIFKTEILERLEDPPRLLIRKPRHIMTTDRRSSPRRRDPEDKPFWVENEEAKILDISERGVRVASGREFLRGERVKMQVAGQKAVYGWVVECKPNGRGSEARVLFEEPATI